ncbi:glycosyltransferase family 31 protein [Amniculicola lignicola CBS 123094]|uniref:N-acetylgalactosaminide beta-1,3-galactosyltransferase n=1 Tax=Amniculicola lignicola CBS 123094 TaxID=1392246 RepID=A0A6A5WJ96_9PLEO|nr:glycosyltransferase family 31 protein [Amniculicola lignicola CBS 123094]
MLKNLPLPLGRRPWRVLLPVLVLVFFVYSLSRSKLSQAEPSPYYQKSTKSFFPPLKRPASNVDPDYCEGFPEHLLADIQIVLKTGAADSTKNKAHLSTVASCISNLLVVSDHAEKIGDRQVIDILAELPASYTVNNTDFEAYAAHKKAHAEGDEVNYSMAGWKLDRFKFLPMVDKAYAVNPKAKWYVFLESDVYFFWDTLFRLVDQMDPKEPHYLGAPVPGSDNRKFAYGGAGFVLSQGLMEKLIPSKAVTDRLSVRYEQWARDDCCGDAVLAYAVLNSTGTRLEALYPTFSGDELKNIKVDRDRWCVPLLSLHRVNPEQMEALWKWERTRPFTPKPFVYSSLLAYTHSHLRDGPAREFWDNLSQLPVPNERPAHRSAEMCGSECSNDPHCLQYSYSQTVCRFANYIKLGNSVDRENGGQGEFVSGWDLGKMAELGFKFDDKKNLIDTSCQQATWLTPVSQR